MSIYEYMELMTMVWVAIMIILMVMDAIEYGVKKCVYSSHLFVPSKYTRQVERNYGVFKGAISELVNSHNLTEEEADKNYLYMKARIYNINTANYKNNIVGLEREVERIELEERKLVESLREPYYSKGH